MKSNESRDLVHKDFMHLGVLDQPVRPQKCKITAKRGFFTGYLCISSQLNARIIAASEKDPYKPITKFNNMARGST